MRWLIVVIACVTNVAHADRYSETYVDRPLVMYAGMTSLDISEDLYRYSAGTTRYDNEFDLYVEHSFGPVAIAFHGVGIETHFELSVPLYCDDELTATFTNDVPQTYLKYAYGEAIDYVHKARVVPHVLALYENVSVGVFEESLTPAMASASAGSAWGASIGASAQVQLAPRLALDVGGGAFFPVTHSSSLQIDPRASGDAHVEIAQTFHAWDLYAYIGLGDITDTHYLYGSAGFVHRWGG